MVSPSNHARGDTLRPFDELMVVPSEVEGRRAQGDTDLFYTPLPTNGCNNTPMKYAAPVAIAPTPTI